MDLNITGGKDKKRDGADGLLKVRHSWSSVMKKKEAV